MTAVLHDIARAALPVAIALLILAATARAALSAGLDDERARRIAAQYFEALATWCLVALATYTGALVLAGEAGAFSIAFALALGAVALVLRVSADEAEAPAAEPAPASAPAPAAPPPDAAGRLWADPTDEESGGRTGLWSRA